MKASPGKVSARYAIIAGTIGESGWIDVLASRNKIDTAAIAGSWERYMIEVVNNPVPGIKKAIVVAGSDRRGTAYGLLSIQNGNRSISLDIGGQTLQSNSKNKLV